jgi:hypothetical protein
MKQLSLYLFMFIAAALLLNSCTKDAKVTPANHASVGNVSDTTILSVATGNGTTIYSGTVSPSPSLGVPGDFYINLANSLFYGPKTTGWGTPITLRGATGLTGAPGSRIYSGTIVPAAALGAIGDFYLNKSNSMFYGPKTASGWGVPISLVGSGNVKTDVFSIGGASWLWNSQYVFETSPGSYTEYFTRYYVRMNNTITQDVLDNGMVLAYFQPSPLNNPNQWAPLPYQFDSSFGFTYNYVYVTAPGQVTFHYFFIQTDPTASLPTLSTYNDETRKFKIVTVTGTTGTFMSAHHVNLNNYQEVSKVTGIWMQDK